MIGGYQEAFHDYEHKQNATDKMKKRKKSKLTSVLKRNILREKQLLEL